ncbi:MAG TPA: DUF4388 domain-containing protein, partial [Kofleriaceae bacterium]
TRMSQAQAEVEQARARAAFKAGDGIPSGVSGDVASSGIMQVGVEEDDLGARPAEVVAGPKEVGEIATHPVLRVVYQLSRAKSTGMLALEGRAGVLKEAYFVDGQPQFVSSNVEAERLGNYLIREGVLSPQALARATSVVHHFGGRLADTLVGLDILDPLEAYRLLAKQVAAKLMEACSWQKGRYTWTAGHANPWKARSLHIDACRVIGAGAAQLAEPLIEEWLAANLKAFLMREPIQTGDLAQFGLGDALLRVYSLLDGRTRLGELAAKVRSPEARTNLLRLTYLLVQTDFARLS